MEQSTKCITRLVQVFWKRYTKIRSSLSFKQTLGFSVEVEKPITVYYRDEVVGNYVADIIVDGKVLLEIKAVKGLSEIHEVQLVNYLKATDIEV